MTGAIIPPDWMADAVCAEIDPSFWFPEPGGQNGSQAKRICNTICPVRDECRDYALARDHLWGIWGGLTERDRQQFRRRTA